MKKIYYREEVEMMMKSAIADGVRVIVKAQGGGSYGDNLCVIDGMVRLADAVSQAMKENEKEEE